MLGTHKRKKKVEIFPHHLSKKLNFYLLPSIKHELRFIPYSKVAAVTLRADFQHRLCKFIGKYRHLLIKSIFNFSLINFKFET